ncbi:glycosyltransferase family 2 protein [Streptomyces longwoodensis]|uniref:glycosyltransferase family 2 protein n=1 Tax=Streptomyces longwoodensis TaxID=68231 RepID=UPI00340023BE
MPDISRRAPQVHVPRQRGGAALVSYVLPVFNEFDGIRHFHQELVAALRERPEYAYELVYVNDGSSDGTLAVLEDIAKNDRRVRVVDFARNFGHQMAITAGIDVARGDAVVVMDTDLQDPPRVSLELIDAWRDGAEIVHARRRSRQDTFFKRTTAHAFYRVLRSSTDVDIPLDTGDFRLMDRRAADELRRFRERSRFVRGMVASMGFRQSEVHFDRDERFAGETKYPLKKMARLAVDGLTGFSTAPLRLITKLGFGVLALSLLGIAYALGMKVLRPDITVSGWTMLMVVVLFLGGVQMLSLGVLGSYIGRTYSEVQGRPLYTVRQVIAHGTDTAPAPVHVSVPAPVSVGGDGTGHGDR